MNSDTLVTPRKQGLPCTERHPGNSEDARPHFGMGVNTMNSDTLATLILQEPTLAWGEHDKYRHFGNSEGARSHLGKGGAINNDTLVTPRVQGPTAARGGT